MPARPVPLGCEDVSRLLAGLADAGAGDAGVADARARRHVESCLRCQAEAAQYRRVLRALRSLRTEVLRPAPGLVADVLAALEEAGERQAVRSLLSGRRVAYLVGVGAATAAGAAGALLLASRSRSRRGVLAS